MNRSLPAPIPLGLHPLPVPSSLLARVAYNHDRGILQLEFRSGAVYQYFQVPFQSYQELWQADSHGAYFNRHVRNFFRSVLLPTDTQSRAIPFSPTLCSQVTSPPD
jgi:KTSC domain